MRKLTHTSNSQRGMTLLVALITLIVLMLLGVGAMVASNTMFKLAGNLQFENEAKNRAESTLTVAENILMYQGLASNSAFTTPNTGNTGPYFDSTSTVPLNPLTSWPSNASSVSATGGQFIIQMITTGQTAGKVSPLGQASGSTCMNCGTPPLVAYNLFRVTARGQSGRGATRFVESIVQIPG